MFSAILVFIMAFIGLKMMHNLLFHADKPLSGTVIDTSNASSTKTGSQVADEMMDKMRSGK